jgi:hypothetical protein
MLSEKPENKEEVATTAPQRRWIGAHTPLLLTA